jgi:hypothetical protein
MAADVQDTRFEAPRGLDGQPIEPPSPGLRRRVVVFTCIVAALGAMLIAAEDRWLPALRDWIASDPDAAPGRLTAVLLILAAFADLPLVFAGVYFWRLGQRTVDERRFPPSGTSLVKPATVLTGDAAVRRGRAAQTTALVLFGLGITLVAALVGLVLFLRDGP